MLDVASIEDLSEELLPKEGTMSTGDEPEQCRGA
jgi:hypothetical protein